MKHQEKPWGRMKTSEETGEISGEITPTQKKPSAETERAVDLKGRHTVDEWLVFVEEEVGPIANAVKDEIRGTAAKDLVSLPQFTELLTRTMENKDQIDMNILNMLWAKLDKLSGKY